MAISNKTILQHALNRLPTDDAELQKEYRDYVLAALNREKAKLTEQETEIRWSATAETLIFILVHFIVLFAAVAAYREFRESTRLRRKGAELKEVEIQVKLESIAIKSSSLAVVLMLVALAFYFMYLRFVYPIQILPG